MHKVIAVTMVPFTKLTLSSPQGYIGLKPDQTAAEHATGFKEYLKTCSSPADTTPVKSLTSTSSKDTCSDRTKGWDSFSTADSPPIPAMKAKIEPLRSPCESSSMVVM